MTKALLLFVWMPFLIFPYHANLRLLQPVRVTCDHAWILMDIVKNNNSITWKEKDPLLMDIREEVITKCDGNH